MIAARCVPIGLGSDIGGSLRWPPAFCGVYGHKPSYDRVTQVGRSGPVKSRVGRPKHLYSVFGPMGSSVSDLIV